MKRGRPKCEDILTPREWQVLKLIHEGLTNEQIGERLGISFGAVKYHVGEIISKLGVASRFEAAEYFDSEGKQRVTPFLVFFPDLASHWGILQRSAAVILVATIASLFVWHALNRSPDGDDSVLKESSPGFDGVVLDHVNAQNSAFAQLQHTLLLSKGIPDDIGEEAHIVSMIPRVESIEQLREQLTEDVNLLVIDKSAAWDLEESGMVPLLLKSGVAILELNVCMSVLHSVDGSNVTVTEVSPSGESRYYSARNGPSSLCDSPRPPGMGGFFAFRAAINQTVDTGKPCCDEALVTFQSGLFRYVISNLDRGVADGILP